MADPRPPLPDLSLFFQEAWRVFRARVWRLLTIAGAGSVGTFIVAMIPIGAAAFLVSAAGAPAAGTWTIAGLISLSIMLWLMSWVQVTMIECAVAEEADARVLACFKRGWPKVGVFSWVCILYMGIVLGGSFEFVLPGFFLSIALLFAPFICVAEGLGGVGALKQSLDDTRGHFFPVLGRTIVAGLITSIPGMIPLVGPFLGAAAGPFTLVALSILHRDLRRARPQPPQPSGRTWWLGAAAAGLVIPLVLGARVLPVLVERAPAMLEAAKRMAENPQDPAMTQKILAILQGDATTAESLSTATSLASQFSAQLSSAAAPSPAAAPAPAPEPAPTR